MMDRGMDRELIWYPGNCAQRSGAGTENGGTSRASSNRIGTQTTIPMLEAILNNVLNNWVIAGGGRGWGQGHRSRKTKCFYAESKKDIYVTLEASLLFWTKRSKSLGKNGYQMNEYGWCVINKIVK